MSGSHVSGTAEAVIENLQRSPRNATTSARTRRTSKSIQRARRCAVITGRVFLHRNSGVWRVNAALWGVSPGFESNDLGFHSRGDRAGAHGVLLWRKQTPDRFSRSRGWWLAKAWTWNFNREVLTNMWMGCGNVLLTNYWQVNGCAGYGLERDEGRLDERRTANREPAEPLGAMWVRALMRANGCRSSVLGNGEWNEHGGFSHQRVDSR